MVKKIAFYCIPEIISEKEWENLVVHGNTDRFGNRSTDWWKNASKFQVSGMTPSQVQDWYKDVGKEGVNEMTKQIKAIRQSVLELSNTKFFGEFDVPKDIIRLIINFTFAKRY